MTQRRKPRFLGLSVLLLALQLVACQAEAKDDNYNPLPLPGQPPSEAFKQNLFDFLNGRWYRDWPRDKGIRNVGPYIDHVYYGVHPAVRIYYSQEVMDWLERGRDGEMPQNAMIIKEMFNPPADRYYRDSTVTYNNDDLVADVEDRLGSWTIMIRDSTKSVDGWFWGSVSPASASNPDYRGNVFGDFGGGRDNTCFRCHASAERELTFVAQKNIEGYPGEPLSFAVDRSWLQPDVPVLESSPQHDVRDRKALLDLYDPVEAAASSVREFTRQFDAIKPVPKDSVIRIPSVTTSHIVSKPAGFGRMQFITSDQCLGCHDALADEYGGVRFAWPDMYFSADGDTANLSPFGEWGWSMMGLAGRDPVFYAQLESEGVLQPKNKAAIVNLCFRCHGVMGQRQFHLDRNGSKAEQDSLFKEAYAMATGDSPYATYGALARDGISCALCHQIIDDGNCSIVPIQTGKFEIGSRDTLRGPFEDVVTHPMTQALGITPKYDAYIQDSRLCGSCHTIFLPVFDKDGKQIKSTYEQTTYLEWLNSSTGRSGPAFRSCQDCHMPDTYHNNDLEFRIATIQDQSYPAVEHLAPVSDIAVKPRKAYRRHTLLGLNVFVLEMFRQFPDILGVELNDPMTYQSNGLGDAIENSAELAREETATVQFTGQSLTMQTLGVELTVTNLTGHKFPSGVGFRRAFLEVALVDTVAGDTLWGSGRTNDLGVIVDANGLPLPSEFFNIQADTQAYEPHYQVITREDQVQIYQELVKTPPDSSRVPARRFTTSFVAIDEHVKDNRLLPAGWDSSGIDKPETVAFNTKPEGRALADPSYMDESGGDIIRYAIPMRPEWHQRSRNLQVKAALYYQAIPPYYLKQRFDTAPEGDDTRRLYYLTSHLNVAKTPAKSWKLLIATASRQVAN